MRPRPLTREQQIDWLARALRDIKRPDAAQALEHRTAREWWLCGKNVLTCEDQPAYFVLSLSFHWSRSPEGDRFWSEVCHQLRTREEPFYEED